MTLAPGDPRHGTANGYSNFKCRCGPCVDAGRQYRLANDSRAKKRAWEHRTGRAKPLEVHLAEIAAQHGTEAKYNAGCRCAECKTASADARQRRRLANPDVSRAYDREYKRRRAAA